MNHFPIRTIAIAALLSRVAACGDDGPPCGDELPATLWAPTNSGCDRLATGTATLTVSNTHITYTTLRRVCRIRFSSLSRAPQVRTASCC